MHSVYCWLEVTIAPTLIATTNIHPQMGAISYDANITLSRLTLNCRWSILSLQTQTEHKNGTTTFGDNVYVDGSLSKAISGFSAGNYKKAMTPRISIPEKIKVLYAFIMQIF